MWPGAYAQRTLDARQLADRGSRQVRPPRRSIGVACRGEAIRLHHGREAGVATVVRTSYSAIRSGASASARIASGWASAHAQIWA